MNTRQKLDNIKVSLGLRTDYELAKKLEISKLNIDSWIKRDKLPEKWELKIRQMNIFYDTPQQGNPTTPQVHIPKLSQKVSAGYHLQAVDTIEQIGEIVLDSSIFKTAPPKGLFCMQVDGYSMIPMVFPDSWVIFDSEKSFRGDGLYIVSWDDCLMVKLLQSTPKKTLKIISVNKDYESWEIDLTDDSRTFVIFGKVVRTIV